MKAWVLDKPAPVDQRPLVLADVPRPEPKGGEVMIRVSACGICRTDLHVAEGELPVRRSPVIPGHQVVGTIEKIGEGVDQLQIGQRVGLAWLNQACGRCRFCVGGRENLCDKAEFTGWTRDGGYAEFVAAPAAFTYPLPDGFDDVQAAPLLCAGIIGYRSLKLTNISNWPRASLGIYGFGAAGHVCLQVARSRGANVYVATRNRERHRSLARELGAVWVGDTLDQPPKKLAAAIVFAPAGEIVPAALAALDKGGTLVLGGIHMSPIPEFSYHLLYGERVIRSVANNTRQDGREFLAEAASIPVKTTLQTFSFDQANDALIVLKKDGIRGAGVLVMS